MPITYKFIPITEKEYYLIRRNGELKVPILKRAKVEFNPNAIPKNVSRPIFNITIEYFVNNHTVFENNYFLKLPEEFNT